MVPERDAEARPGSAGDRDAGWAAALADRDRQLAELTDALRRVSLQDPLTGLATRAILLEQASRSLARAARTGSGTAVVSVDLDSFNEVNDMLGHTGGDVVLVEVGRRLEGLFRASDTVARSPETVARLGGDEFIIVCEQVGNPDAARAVGRRIAGALARPVDVGGRQVAVTASVGISLALPGRTDVGALLLEAGAAMRRAKEQGHGLCEVYAEGMRSSATREAVDALRVAVDHGQLRLHYQPKIALGSDRVVGVEALLRWEDPARGLVPPHEFIGLAEESGLILPIGSWVLREACRQAAQWHRERPDRPPLVVSVNVSPRQFGPALVQVVAAVLVETGVPPETLCLEVTEGILMDDVEGAIVTLHQLARLGVALSVDDFGTGYSSFSYLKRLRLDELKIDKSFVDGLGRDANDTAIVAAVVAMAQALGLRVVAEGVETADQLLRLRALGCEEVQGYHLARPGPPATITSLLAAEREPGFRSHAGAQPLAPRQPERGGTPMVLVVDDTPEVRQLARMSLSAVGFDVQEAADGATALAMARELVPDGIVLDVVMPDLSGIEVCRRLRADPGTAGITIVVASANAEADDKVEAFSAGADDYIVKPFSPRDLTSRMHAALRRRQGVDEGHGSPGAGT